MVSNVWIFGLSIVFSFFSFFVLVSFSTIINFACLLKLWYFSQKYLHANMVLGWGFVTSFPWLFSLTLKRISVFLTYCFLHNVHFIKYMTYALEQLTSWKILYVFWVCWLLKVDVVSECFWLFFLQCCFRFSYCRWIP